MSFRPTIWGNIKTKYRSAPQFPNPLCQLLVTGMGVHDRRQRAYVASEPLGQEKVAGCSVHVRCRSVSKRMQGIEAIKPILDLPTPERMLNPALGDALPTLVSEER